MHRSIMDSAMWESEPFSRSQAWIDMLMLANHKPRVIFRRGVKVEIPRGGIGKSIRTLAERWSWSHGKVERFFSFLLDEEMVKKVGTKKTSVDTCYFIVNYDKYQDCGDENREEDGKKTGRRREEDGDGTRMEEGKNGRKEINNLPDSANRAGAVDADAEIFYLSKKKKKLKAEVLESFTLFWKPFPYPHGKAEAPDAWLSVYSPGMVDAAIKAAMVEAQGRADILANGKSPKWAQGWLTGRRWEDGDCSQHSVSGSCSECRHRNAPACVEKDDSRRLNCKYFEAER